MRERTEEERGKKIWGVNDGLIKRQVEERGEHGGRQRDAESDQYNRVMICSLQGSGGTALRHQRSKRVCVCVCVQVSVCFLIT